MVLQSPSQAAFLPLNSSTFEGADGNQVVDDTTLTDWETFLPDTATDNLFRAIDTESGANDNSLSGGTKDDTECAAATTGSIPNNKDDLLRFYLAHESIPNAGTGLNETFLYLGYVRALSGTTTASAHGVFELNQVDTKCPPQGKGQNLTPSPFYVRTPGDVRLAFDDEGGSQPLVAVQRWQEPCAGNRANDLSGCWSAKETLNGNQAAGDFNDTDIVDRLNSATGDTLVIGPESFSEVKVNMNAAGLLQAGNCVGFGAAGLFTGSSGNSDNEQSKDFIAPIPININNCGSIRINKTFSSTAPSTPAVFMLYKDNNPFGGSAPHGAEDTLYTRPATTQLNGAVNNSVTAITVDDSSVLPATGYAKVDSEVVKITANNTTTDVITVVRNSAGSTGGAAAHADNTVIAEVPACAFTANGSCTIASLPFGGYWVSEVAVPTGYQPVADQLAVVSTSTAVVVSFTNDPSPIDIAIAKRDGSNGVVPLCTGTVTSGCSEFKLYTVGATNSLKTAAAANGTTLGLNSSDTFAASGQVLIDKEIISYTANDIATDVLSTLTRAQAGSTAADHAAAATVEQISSPVSCTATAAQAAAGNCTFLTILPGSYVIIETKHPAGRGFDPDLPQHVTVALGDTNKTYTFDNPPLYKVITVVCRESDTSLYSSKVSYDDAALPDTANSPGAGSLSGGGITDAEICGLSGTYVHSDVATGLHTGNIRIP